MVMGMLSRQSRFTINTEIILRLQRKRTKVGQTVMNFQKYENNDMSLSSFCSTQEGFAKGCLKLDKPSPCLSKVHKISALFTGPRAFYVLKLHS